MLSSFYITANDFRSWSPEHWVWLAYAVLTSWLWIRWGQRAPTRQQQREIGLWLGLVGVASWVYAEVVMFATNQTPWQSIVPLHLCYFLCLTLPYVIWQERLDWLDWLYPIVMAGCLQALFTPDLDDTAPHFYSIRYWLVHVALVQSVLYAVFVYGFRPSALGILKCVLFLNLYALVVTPVNLWLGTNFLYLREPASGSVMEFLGPWPYYLVAIEGLMLVLFTLVYLPFARRPVNGLIG